jgi:antirestriction protein ArdC
MAHALGCRPETIPDARPDDLNRRVLALFERGLVPWVLPWRLAVTAAEVRLSEDVPGKDAYYPELDLQARLTAATNPTAPRDVDAEFQKLFAATGIDFRLGAIRTFYSLSDDMIALSDWRSSDPTDFLRDWIHELIHAVGHPSRGGDDRKCAQASRTLGARSSG